MKYHYFWHVKVEMKILKDIFTHLNHKNKMIDYII